MHIADILLHLQRVGHPHYVEWSISYACNKVTQSELKGLKDELKIGLQDWVNRVSILRAELYALNYFTCLQLLKISKEFYCLINNPNHEISNEILLLLMSLAPDLTVEKIKEVTSTDEAQSIALKSLPSFTPPDHTVSYCVMDEVDIPGEIEKLNEEDKELYSSIIEDYGFNPQMVLAAIRQFGSNEDVVLKWCFDPKNAEMFKSKPGVNEDSSTSLSTSVIDISNTTVQELVDLKFSESLSIEAVKSCGEDFTKCFDYCSQWTAKNASFNDDTQDEISDNILLDLDASCKAEIVDPILLKCVQYVSHCI